MKLNELHLIETKATANSRGRRNGGISLVYHKNGKRIEFSQSVLSMLGEPESVTFQLDRNYLVILADNNGHKLNITGKRAVIYNAMLVKEIIKFYDIQESCSSFNEIETVEGLENAVAIKIR